MLADDLGPSRESVGGNADPQNADYSEKHVLRRRVQSVLEESRDRGVAGQCEHDFPGCGKGQLALDLALCERQCGTRARGGQNVKSDDVNTAQR